MNEDNTGLLIQLLRGLDGNMPEALRPLWEKLTPQFQQQQSQEQAEQAQMAEMLRSTGSEPAVSETVPELMQYRRSRR
jgi:hypothetical protein